MKKLLIFLILILICSSVFSQEEETMCPCIIALGTPSYSLKTKQDFTNRVLLISTLVEIPCWNKNNDSRFSIANQKYRRGIELQFFEYLYENYRENIVHMKGHHRSNMPLLIYSPNQTAEEIELNLASYFGRDYSEKIRTSDFKYDHNKYLSDEKNGAATMKKWKNYKAYFLEGTDY